MFGFDGGQFGWGQPNFGFGGGTDYASILSSLFHNIMNQSRGSNPFYPQPSQGQPKGIGIDDINQIPTTGGPSSSPPPPVPEMNQTGPGGQGPLDLFGGSQGGSPPPPPDFSGSPTGQSPLDLYDRAQRPSNGGPSRNPFDDNPRFQRGGGLLGLGQPKRHGWGKLAGDIFPGFGARR